MLKKGKIYKITNKVNDKVYIGQTIQTLKKRFNGHCCYSKSDRSTNMYIKRAIHKYGRDNFSIELIEECLLEELNDKEKYWIAYYDSYNNGYNLTEGGQDSNVFSLNRLESTIDIKKFQDYIIEFKPLAKEVADHFGISKCSVYNLIKRLDNPKLILESYNPRKPKILNTQEVLDKYNEGWSILDMCKYFKVRKDRISNLLREYGIQPRRGLRGYKHRI